MLFPVKTTFQVIFLCLCLLALTDRFSFAADLGDQEIQRQQELERQRRQEREDARPEVNLQPESLPAANLDYPENESPCFLIREIRLEGDSADKFQWALKAADDAIGRCLGGKGINILMSRVQNKILDAGFVTTRIVASPQDLNSGILVLTVIPGRVGLVKLSEGSSRYIWLRPAMPVKSGEILNIRKVEQGLENLKRIPSANAEMKLLPGNKEGESDLAIKRTQARPIRLTLSADDSGSRYTGRYQGSATLSLDNLLGLSDMFYATINRDLEQNKPYGTNGYSIHYSIPWGFYQLAFNVSGYEYHQMVAGVSSNYEYSGESDNASLELSRVIHRTSRSKTSLSVAAFLNTSQNYIDKTELEIQRRRLAGWELGINHRQHFGSMTLDSDLRFHRGTGAFNSLRAPEEAVDEGTSRPEILTMSLRLQAPFKLWQQNFRYSSHWRQQWAFRNLLARDRFSIGGRYSVRGYNGDMTLSADNGFTFRNELAWALGKSGQELYTAVDVGRVWGPFDEYLLGQSLSGLALGLRGAIKRFSYDAFVSRPLNRPDGFPGPRWVAGFTTSLQF